MEKDVSSKPYLKLEPMINRNLAVSEVDTRTSRR